MSVVTSQPSDGNSPHTGPPANRSDEPAPDFDSDDVYDGEGNFLFGGGAKARRSVELWHIENVGRRPIDYMARDLVFAGLLRDHRQWPFHRLVSSPAPWMESRTPEWLSPSLKKLAVQATVHHFLHVRTRYAYLDTVKYETATAQALGRFRFSSSSASRSIRSNGSFPSALHRFQIHPLRCGNQD